LEQVYGIPPEQVVGSSIKTQFALRDGQPVLVRLPELNFIDDKAGKPVGINQHIGRRPIMAFGNSNGDQQMLEYTQAGSGARFELLVLHDDAAREYAYGPARGLPDVKLGAFTAALDEQAKKAGWTVVSMKNDWKQVFPFEQSPVTAIDILLEPDAVMLQHAAAGNEQGTRCFKWRCLFPPPDDNLWKMFTAHAKLHVTNAGVIVMALVSSPKPSRVKVREHRERLRAQGLRPIQIWVPDVRARAFRSAAHRQSLAVATSAHASKDQAFIDAVSGWSDE
jgi:hypothetical protein